MLVGSLLLIGAGVLAFIVTLRSVRKFIRDILFQSRVNDQDLEDLEIVTRRIKVKVRFGLRDSGPM
jgi:hypothetical protein